MGPSTVSGGGDDRIKLQAVVADRSGSCPALSFRLGGIAVQTTANTDFDLPCGQIVNEAAVEAQGARMTGGVLVAREIEAEAEARQDPEFEAEGPIESVSPASDCQTTSGRNVTVLGLGFAAGSFTEFRDIAQGCAGLAVGIRVRARGALTNPPASPVQPLQARRVELRQS